MGDEQQGALEVDEQAFQPLNGREVEMVGRLVEQQQLGVGDQRARQRDTLFQAAGQGIDCTIGIQAQPLQRFLHPTVEPPGIVDFQLMRQPLQVFEGVHVAFGHPVRRSMVIGQQALRLTHAFGHRLEYRMPGLKLRLLRHVSQLQRRLAPHLARIRRVDPGDDLEQAGLAGAIAPDQTDTLPGLDHQRGAVKQRPMAIGQFESVKSKQGHGASTVHKHRGGIIRD